MTIKNNIKILLIISITISLLFAFSLPEPYCKYSQYKKKQEWKVNFPKKVDYVSRMPNPDSLWIFVMAGQSNMAGRGFIEPQDTIPNRRIITIGSSGEWIYAKEPMHYYEPDLAGLDCGLAFANKLLKSLPNNISIGVIPCAVGGSSIEQWLQDETYRGVHLLTNFKNKTNLSKDYGEIKGILWHQGESNANPHLIPEYRSSLDSLIRVFRNIVGNDSLPVLIGELGSYAEPIDKQNLWDSINHIIHEVAINNSNVAIINTKDLKNKGDKVHFDSESQRKLGERFAVKYLELTMPAHNSGSRNSIDTNIVLPPAWAFGILYGGYTNQQETIDRIKALKKHQYPIDAYWIDSWFWSYAEKGKGPKNYIDFIADTVSFPDRKKMWDYLQKNGIKGGFWIWDCILKTGNEKAFNDFASKGFFAEIFVNKNSWHNKGTSTAIFQETKEHPGTLCGNIDFKNPEAVKYFKSKMKHFFDEGADFIKLDRTTDIAACKTMFEMCQKFGKETKGRGFVLSHSSGTENEEYKRYPAKWTDDTRSDWTIEKPLVDFNSWVPPVAFKENIAMYTDTSLATSKIPFLANDLGGFDMGKVKKPDEELYIRWLQFSMFNPVTEVFSQPENPTSNLAWMYSNRADSIFREYAQWRLKLFPYIYSYALRSRLEGKRILGKFADHKFQYLFGDEMLLAPVYEKGSINQTVYLPEGNWVNYWTGETLSGKNTCLVNAPIQHVPLFIKQGAIIPMRNYASSVEKGNNKTIILEIYAGADGSFTLYEDDGTSNEYLSGKYSLTHIEWTETNETSKVLNISPVAGEYKGMPQKRQWIINLHLIREPLWVMINGKKCDFRYNNKKKIISVEVPSSPCESKLDIKFRF